MTILERAAAPTPEFFKMLRRIGLSMLGVSGLLLFTPVALTELVLDIASYVASAGTGIIAACQLTVDEEALKEIRKKSAHGQERNT